MSSSKHISLSECVDGYIYDLDSRNLGLGLFRQTTSSFIGIRLKFHDRFLDEEFHWDQDGTAKPLQLLGRCPVYHLVNPKQWHNSKIIFNYLELLRTLEFQYDREEIIGIFIEKDLGLSEAVKVIKNSLNEFQKDGVIKELQNWHPTELAKMLTIVNEAYCNRTNAPHPEYEKARKRLTK